jgi:hypothetical protein
MRHNTLDRGQLFQKVNIFYYHIVLTEDIYDWRILLKLILYKWNMRA